ncbi:uncharacterized protein BDCG_16644 [Blastomyces dermatitidis ER-3]|uniref:Uncharacterized protein n=1 Tax=Ajellomyces dermatitidis (strain ER-3 / ATCC MYA-2586) TaxID=559297 RepID=A0ABX2VTL0_AJEDR|nr:uncharacterized protein BDCG_16644 [Blastomyces dermatitidis ER-3]OAT00518.1 hypothetical protein BDCG_16644 [Blastomyces dermatitidis ER-3]
MTAGGAEDRLDADASASRRDDTSLHSTATTAAAARDAGEKGDVAMEAVLPRLIDTVFTFNLAFFVVAETAAAL